eukprot:CAMPEP_0201523106 /NCGR_PEP_ID=MMETSP0161_2-20130828/18746_1 /ASSEMBLY_ACC=CAM_ASM_000251 /TAXON_ID=180227 /ORGANISM="Neoparamoeba aestuarina, Strain SoJaBio B1-5/56/2" /LENGTH=292 /DNA_ID=CAMNT_0047922109 /DNA_START=58 /DNA_END=936 /DNA_ORIENTATION=-
MDDIVESTDNNHSSEAEVMGDRFLASLDFLEKKLLKGTSGRESKERNLLLKSENDVLKKENDRLKREMSYNETLHKLQEQHQAIFELESKYFALKRETQNLETEHATMLGEHQKEKKALEDSIEELNQNLSHMKERANKTDLSLRKMTSDYSDLKMSRDCSERAAKETISSLQKEMNDVKHQMKGLKRTHTEEIRALDQNRQKERLQYEEKLLTVGENARQSWVQQKQQYEQTISDLQQKLKEQNEEKKDHVSSSSTSPPTAVRRSKRAAPPPRKRLRKASPNVSKNTITFD